MNIRGGWWFPLRWERKMDRRFGRFICTVFTPAADRLSELFFHAARARAIQLLRLKAMERVLIVGVNTGLDIPFLPPGLWVTGVDSNASKLQRARERTHGHYVTLERMDPQSLQYADHSFNAVILHLVLGNTPDSATTFQEAWRVVRPGGRLVILDRFLPEGDQVSPICLWFERITRTDCLGMNRRLSDVIGSRTEMVIERNEPATLYGCYQIILIRKEKSN